MPTENQGSRQVAGSGGGIERHCFVNIGCLSSLLLLTNRRGFFYCFDILKSIDTYYGNRYTNITFYDIANSVILKKELCTLSGRLEQGALTEGVYLILISMLTPRHGYAVMQHIEALTEGRVMLGAGTLYGAINNLLEKEWICAVGHGVALRKKEYEITPTGREILQAEIRRLEELIRIGKQERYGAGNAN